MSELIERVAKALEPKCRGFGGLSMAVAIELARTAVEAMREPTRTMLKACCAAMSEGKRPTPERVSSKEKHRIRYRAMIESELSQQTFAEAVALSSTDRVSDA